MNRSHEHGDAVSAIVTALEKYLEAHPGAADNIQGIARWWLAPDTKFPSGALHKALEHLVAQGRVEAHVVPGGTRIYRDRPHAASKPSAAAR